jgi:hypothetical protein
MNELVIVGIVLASIGLVLIILPKLTFAISQHFLNAAVPGFANWTKEEIVEHCVSLLTHGHPRAGKQYLVHWCKKNKLSKSEYNTMVTAVMQKIRTIVASRTEEFFESTKTPDSSKNGQKEDNTMDKDLECFRKYLVDHGYKEFTPSGHPSTVYDYSKRIKRICNEEGISIAELASNISFYCDLYDIGGEKEEKGEVSHRAVINALKAYREYINNID